MNRQNHDQLNYKAISRYSAIMRFILTWLATVAIFIIIFLQIKFIDVINILKRTDIKFFCAAIFFSLLAHLIFSSARYQQIVKLMECKLSFFEAVMIRMGCNPIKGILPFKAGELTILVYMKKKYNLSYPRGIFSLLFGYIFSCVALMLFYLLGGIFYFYNNHQRIIYVVLFLMIVSLISALSLQKSTRRITEGIKKIPILPEEIKSLMVNNAPQGIKTIFFNSLGIEGCKLFIIFILMKSLNIEIPVDALLLFGSATVIAAYLPITYWGLGIRESVILVLFSGYATPDKLLAGSLLITFVDGLLPVLLGLFFLKPFLNNLWADDNNSKKKC